MDMILGEEKVKEIWDDEVLLSVIEGCKHVIVEAKIDRTGKYLVLIPASIIFERWAIEMSEDMVRELEQIVDIVPLPGKDE